MKRSLIVCALTAVLATSAPASDSPLQTEPFQYREDFESGEAKSWASYPPAQDVAFDPSLQVVATPSIGKFSLARLVRPVASGRLSFGLLKRVEFLLAPGGRVGFSYFAHTYSLPEALRIVLCGADGARYLHSIPLPARDEWSQVDVPVDRFRAAGRAPASGLAIQAVYWELDVPNAQPEDQHALYLDNLDLTGAVAARVALRAPRTFVAPEWGSLLAVDHFNPGDVFAPRAEDGTALTYELRDPSGQSQGRFSASDGFRVPADAPRGVWNATVAAPVADGSLRSSVAFLVTAPWPRSVHPRLYVREEDRKRLRQRMQAPEAARLWADVEMHARQLRSTVNIEAGRSLSTLATNPSFDGLYPYLDILRTMGGLVQVNAFVAWLTGDPEAKAAARAALLEACRWETWTHPWFTSRGYRTYYPVGIFGSALAFGYDLLYHDLSPDERRLVVKAIMDKAVVPSFHEYYLNNRVPFHTSNWIAHTAGGPLIALLATAEAPEEAEPYFSGLLHKLRAHWDATYLPDGSYGEGIGYQRFDMEASVRLLAALKNVLGTDLGRESGVVGSHVYPLYALRAPDRQIDFGDSSDRPGVLTPWAWIASDRRDGHVAWYYEQYLKQRTGFASDRRPASDLFDFIWHEAVTAKPPIDLPTSRHFPDKGGVIFRSGWNDDALVLSLTAGPFFNHNHLDQGSFQLAGFGEQLLSEAGPTEYYKDEYYSSYFIQSIGHNTVLVDGNPATQRIADHRSAVAALDRYPRIVTALTTEVHDQVRADLQPVYAPLLTRADRTLMFVKPHYVVLFDRLASADAHRYSQIFHPDEAGDLEVNDREAWIRKGKAELWMRFVLPDAVRLEKRLGRVTMTEIGRMQSQRLSTRAYLEASTPAASSAANFMVVLYPRRAGEGPPPEVEKVEAPDLAGIRVRRGRALDEIGFALRDGARTRLGNIDTDARSFCVSYEEQRVRILSVEDATVLRVGPRLWMQSDVPIAGVAYVATDRVDWRFANQAETTLRLFTGFNPSQILVDKRRLPRADYSFDRKESSIRLRVRKGTAWVSVQK